MFVALPMPRWYLFVADPTAAAAALRGENCNTKKKKEEKEKEKEIVSNMNYNRYHNVFDCRFNLFLDSPAASLKSHGRRAGAAERHGGRAFAQRTSQTAATSAVRTPPPPLPRSPSELHFGGRSVRSSLQQGFWLHRRRRFGSRRREEWVDSPPLAPPSPPPPPLLPLLLCRLPSSSSSST